jgi:hypothetical protein
MLPGNFHRRVGDKEKECRLVTEAQPAKRKKNGTNGNLFVPGGQ